MKSIANVVYVTDFSDNSIAALRTAFQISQKAGAQLVVLHVFDIPATVESPTRDSLQDIEKDVALATQSQLEEFCETNLGEQVDLHAIRYVAKENDSAVHGIVAMIDECQADLVVMGSKGKSKLYELIMGSTATAVIESASCPVLVVPKQNLYTSFEKMLYATDCEDKDIEAIRILAEFASLFDAHIIVVHISATKELTAKAEVVAGEEKMKWFTELVLERVNYPNISFQVLLSKDIYKRLNSYLKDNNIPLIAMLERTPKGIFNRWFHRDLVRRMEWQASVPLLSFNEVHLPHISKVGPKLPSEA